MALDIIDLCSDSSDNDVDRPLPPPKKRPRFDVPISTATTHAENATGKLAIARPGPRPRFGPVAGMLKGWTLKSANANVDVTVGAEAERDRAEEKREEEHDDDVKEESPHHTEREAPALAAVSAQPLEQELQPPFRDEDDKYPAPSFSKDDDILLIEVKDPDTFSNRVSNMEKRPPDDVKPVTRIETVQTETGTRKRKLLGPFVLDDEDDENSLFCSRDDEEYPSVNGDKGSEQHGNSNAAKTSASGSNRPSRKTTLDEVELYRRRKLSEDKCAEVSRRMREEAIARREAERYSSSDSMVLSRGSLEDASDGSVAGALPLSPNAPSVMRSSKTVRKPKRDVVNRVTDQFSTAIQNLEDHDDLFSDNSLPQNGDIEAQLDLAQVLASTDSYNGDFPSAKDSTRSSPSSGSLVEDGEADTPISDAGSRSNDREDILNAGSIPSPEKDLLNGRVGRIATSGSEHYGTEQAEMYWERVNKAARRNEKRWPKMVQFEHIDGPMLPKRRDDGAVGDLIDDVKARDEARLLAAKNSSRLPKEPLRAAPNMNGGLVQLLRMAEKDERDESRRDRNGFQRQSEQSYHWVPFAQREAHHDQRVDQGNWIKGGSLRKRKRDIENLMNAFEETAKCWCLAFDSIKPPLQIKMKADVKELRMFADRILQGYCTRDKTVSRLNRLKNNVRRRTGQDTNGIGASPSRYAIDLQLRKLMGQERFQHAQELLNAVLVEHKESRAKNKSHHKSGSSKTDSNRSVRNKPIELSNKSVGGVEEIYFESDNEDPYKGFDLSQKQRVAWAREDAKIEEKRQILARFDEGAEPKKPDNQTKKVRFADTVPSDLDFDQAGSPDSEISDEDEDEDEDGTEPSFGRGKTSNNAIGPMTATAAGSSESSRRTVGGKGLLSDLRKEDEALTSSNQLSARMATHEKGVTARTGNVPLDKERQDPGVPERSSFGRKSVSMLNQEKPQEQSGFSDVEECEHDAKELDSDVEGSPSDNEEDAANMYDDARLTQYEVLADYENFDGFDDAQSVPLGKHIDINAAFRQMKRITTDVTASASRNYRRLRIIWDTDDFELSAQTVILPTGGEYRVRMVKSWVPATNWPGKQRPRQVDVPKVFYVVHETKTTSLRPLTATRGDIADQERFGPDDSEQPNAGVEKVEKERDMCFSSRQSANGIAKNRFWAFSWRNNHPDEEAGSSFELDEYMQQIENDRACFKREKTISIENKDGGKGEEKIHIWVEEMIADMPHI